MTTINDFVDAAMSGQAATMKTQFDTLARAAINLKIEALRPAVHASIFNAPALQTPVKEATEDKNSDFHIKFKDKSNGQWFQSKKFASQNEMTQHFWTKIKPVAGEVQFHGPKGRIAEDMNILEASLEELSEEFEPKPTFITPGAKVKTPGAKVKGRVFSNASAAAEFLRNNKNYAIVSVKDGVTRVAKNR